MGSDEGRGGRSPSRPVLLARILAGSWRADPPPAEFSAEDLREVVDLLTGSGAGALAWWKIRHSGLAATKPAETLRQAYLSQSLQSALHEGEVEHVFGLLRSQGVEPILVKGWAAGRLYPEAGLRPAGDIDLLVRPSDQARAKRMLRGEPGRKRNAVTDIFHDEFRGTDDHLWDSLCERSRLVRLNGTDVRVMGDEDHLHFLCLHLLRHSGYRPLWLCDVAAALEGAPQDFDWGVVLGADSVRRNWVGSVLSVARTLLGAENDSLPEEALTVRAPGWVVAEVLRQWERPRTVDHRPRDFMATSLRRPSRALPAMLARWPDPIRASVGLRLPLDESPKLTRQVRFYLVQSISFLKRAASTPNRNATT